jgi:hypothetical protein
MKIAKQNIGAIIIGLKIGSFGIFVGWLISISVTAFQALEIALMSSLP